MLLRRLFAMGLAITGALVLSVPPWSALTWGQGEVRTEVPREFADQVPQELRDQISMLSTGAMKIAAQALGITEVMGKPLIIETGGSPPRQAKPVFEDIGIALHPTKHENEPHVAASPVNPNNLVVGSHFFGAPAPTANRCIAFNSFDGGHSWSDAILMPQLAPYSACSDPVVAFAPDGGRIYYAYMDIKNVFTPSPPTLTIDFDIVVSYSDNGGLTWTGPIVALDGAPTTIVFNPPPTPPTVTPGFTYDKPWIATHVDQAQSNWVYVTATRFDQGAPYLNHIVFTRSANRAASWGAPATLDSSPDAQSPPPVITVQGSRPAGGVGGNVLVAWYHSNAPPADPIGWLNNSFLIRTRHSANNGGTFGPVVDAVLDAFEAPYYLGPQAQSARWWGAAMFPDVKIAGDGSAHLVYSHDPDRNVLPSCPPAPIPCFQSTSVGPEDGDVRYSASAGPPYLAWSMPVTLNDDGPGRAQGKASIVVQDSTPPTLKVTFFDTRRSPSLVPNTLYDVFSTERGPSEPWRPNFRVSDRPSITDFDFFGDYFGLAANRYYAYAVWTDRRHQNSYFGFEDNVFGSLILPTTSR